MEKTKTKIRSLEKQINFFINKFYFYKSFEFTADLMKGTPRVSFYQSLYKFFFLEMSLIAPSSSISCQRMKIYCLKNSVEKYSLQFVSCHDVEARFVVQFLRWCLPYRLK